MKNEDHSDKWFADYGNILMTARYLVEEDCMDADELLHFLEKPWKWEEKFREAQNLRDCGDPHPGRDADYAEIVFGPER